jgi:hypothetical protein
LARKILAALEFGAFDMTTSAQNPGKSGVASKILRIMDLMAWDWAAPLEFGGNALPVERVGIFPIWDFGNSQ